jgi:hypothetical protein
MMETTMTNMPLNSSAIHAGIAWVWNASEEDRSNAWSNPDDNRLCDRIFLGARESVACGVVLGFDLMGESPALTAIVADGDIWDDAKMVGPVLGVPEIVAAIRQFLCAPRESA